MARATRIALDLALVSLRNIQPAVARIWNYTKSAIANTAAKPIVNNRIVCKVETSLDKLAETLQSKLLTLRNRQFPREIKYLEQELEKVRRRMSNDASSKTLTLKVGTAWQYAKTEMVPPMTLAFFNGPAGKKIESVFSQAANSLIDGLQKGIQEIDAQEQRKIKEKADAIKAAIEKQKAETKKKAGEIAKKEAEIRAIKDKEAEAKALQSKEPPKEEKKKAPVTTKKKEKKKKP